MTNRDTTAREGAGDPAIGPADAPAIGVTGLRVRRGRAAVLHGLTVTVPRGQVVGLLGPSGCGKTTLMRAIVGVQQIESGTVSVLGQPAGSAALRRSVGYVTQAPSVYDDLTVRQNLDYFRRVLGAPPADVQRVLDATDLGREHARLVGELSGGQRSRVSLAAAMLGSPELLVLDEPTVGLDPVLRVELWGLFHALADAGVSLLVSSHVMDEATRCDRLLLMRSGEILFDDTPAALLGQTGAQDAEAGFLDIITGQGASGAAAAAAPGAPPETGTGAPADAAARPARKHAGPRIHTRRS